MKFHICNSCDSEFRVIADKDSHVDFCPFCGSTIEDDEEELDDDFEE